MCLPICAATQSASAACSTCTIAQTSRTYGHLPTHQQRCLCLPQGTCFLGGRTLLVTEYMEGGSLAHNLRAKKVSWWRRGKKVAMDVARALVYLHSRRIIHLGGCPPACLPADSACLPAGQKS